MIGVAPIKDHNLCHASMSMKNWYGLLGGRRNQFHQAIHDIVSDLGFMMKPRNSSMLSLRIWKIESPPRLVIQRSTRMGHRYPGVMGRSFALRL